MEMMTAEQRLTLEFFITFNWADLTYNELVLLGTSAGNVATFGKL